MRRFAIGTMLILGLAVGCEKPIDGIPGPSGSGVSDLSVEVPAAADAKPAEPAADKPAETPAAPAAEKPADAPAETPKQSSVETFKGTKFVSNTSLKVPTMSCPHGCWPTVEKTLAAQPGVEEVALAKQAGEDAIDNPVVYIKLNGKFDAQAAVAALAKAGFEKAVVAN